MLNPSDTGRIIAELRRQAGFTQQSLAGALCVTDKAVSKWERGLSCPDISLLPKLSILLDADIEALLSGVADIYSHKWRGVLYVPEGAFPLDTLVYDKPLVYYLLANFLLVGITDVLVIAPQGPGLDGSILGQIEASGLSLSFFRQDAMDLTRCLRANEGFVRGSSAFVLSDVCFLFGASLTRSYQSFMSIADGSIQVHASGGEKTPLLFVSERQWELFFAGGGTAGLEEVLHGSVRKKLSRGIICLPIRSHRQLCDVSNFVRFYQEHHRQQICDLQEIARNRDLALPSRAAEP